jgi:hypothetical protein
MESPVLVTKEQRPSGPAAVTDRTAGGIRPLRGWKRGEPRRDQPAVDPAVAAHVEKQIAAMGRECCG